MMLLNNIFNLDPTRTTTLRQRFSAQMYNKFRALKGDIRESIDSNDVFGLKTNEPLRPGQFAFERDPQKVALFLEWLEEQINNGILETYYIQQIGQAIESAWTNIYITTAYEKGVERARIELKNAGYTLPDAAFLLPALQMPVHADRVGLLYTRTFTGLKGITDEMSKQISVILAQGMAEGKHPREIAKLINDRVDKIGITRARTLARTEIIRAHHQATIQEYKNWGVLGVSVLAEWTTAGDSRVCDICKRLARRDNGHGPGIYTLDMIWNMIPAHPNCRCIALPLNVSDNEQLRNAA